MDRAAKLLAILKNALVLADDADDLLIAAQIALPLALLEDRLLLFRSPPRNRVKSDVAGKMTRSCR